jgi:hypothetical protein
MPRSARSPSRQIADEGDPFLGGKIRKADDAETISLAAWTLLRLAGEAAMAAAALDRALALNPNAALRSATTASSSKIRHVDQGAIADNKRLGVTV